MRIVCALAVVDPVDRAVEALSARGHRVLAVEPSALENTTFSELASADLIVVDASLAAQFDVVSKVTAQAPGIEIVLVGDGTAMHPDVIDHLARPLGVERLVEITDEIADIKDGARMNEPVELVAYETLFAGESPVVRELVRRVRLIARSDAPVSIFGDDGSGRSIIARAIHDRSARRHQPFLSYNCAAHSDEELCRRLFRGEDAAVSVARLGTLFIERLALAGPLTQRELVNYIETRDKGEPGARLVVGVQRDAAVSTAPSELFFRLKVLEIEIPTLAQRGQDLEQIVRKMLERLAPNRPQAIAPETMQLLVRYAFPGNVLELAHALTHAFVLARGSTIEPQHLPIMIRKAVSEGNVELAQAVEGELQALDIVAKRFERDYLLRVLRSVDGNRGRAAEILGLSRKGLWGKLKSHGISDDDIESEDAT